MPQGNDVAICGLVLTVLGATRARPLRWDLHLTKYQGTGGNYLVLSKSLIQQICGKQPNCSLYRGIINTCFFDCVKPSEKKVKRTNKRQRSKRIKQMCGYVDIVSVCIICILSCF